MGMVRESESYKPKTYKRLGTITPTGAKVTRPDVNIVGTTRLQYGYRSGPLSSEETAAIQLLSATGKRSDIRAQLDALKRIEAATTASPLRDTDPFIVNERDFTVVKRSPALYSYRTEGWIPSGQPVHRASGNSLFAISSPNSPVSMPDPEESRGLAGELMRGMTPTRPDFDLTRFVLELRDVNRIFATASSLPSLISPIRNGSGKSAAQYGSDLAQGAGSSYLGYQFGIAPTVSDIMRGSEAILKADQKFGQFIRDSAQLVKRSSSRVIDNFVSSASTTTGISAFGSDLVEWVVRGTGGASWLLSQYSRPDIAPVNVDARLALSMHAQSRIRAFCTFEYFVGDPDGFTSRMDYYVEKAKKTLGSGLTTSVAYELAPWSWMLDWHIDIGGLLNYQQSVSDYGTVARRAGFTVEREVKSSISVSNVGSYLYPRTGILGTAHGSQTVFESKRRSGSPYSMDFNWDYGTFQWSILGALGLTKAPRVPNRR